MNITEVRKKIKVVQKLLSEYDMLTALCRSMNKTKEMGLDVSSEYYDNVKRRIVIIEARFNELLK